MSVSRDLFWEICTMKAPSSLFLQLCCVCVNLFVLDEYGKLPLDWTLKGYFSPTQNLTCDRQEVSRASLVFVLLPAQFLGLAIIHTLGYLCTLVTYLSHLRCVFSGPSSLSCSPVLPTLPFSPRYHPVPSYVTFSSLTGSCEGSPIPSHLMMSLMPSVALTLDF